VKSTSIKNLQDYTVVSKYSRYLPELRRREVWDEAVKRMEDMNISVYPELEEDIRWAFSFVYEKILLGSQRALQFGGEAALRANLRIYNCFAEETEFITSAGVKSFSEFSDGEVVRVLTHTGQWQSATVRSFGEQQLYKIKIGRGRASYTVRATKDHQWLLKNGARVTEIRKNDKLLEAPNIFVDFDYDAASPDEKLYWCYGMVYGDGTRIKNKDGVYAHSMIRLCDHARKFKYRFEEMGFSTSSPLSCKGDFMAYTGTYLKTCPDPAIDAPRLVRAFVAGYLDADGCKNKNGAEARKFGSIQATGQPYIDFIRKCFPIAGIYIVSEHDLSNTSTNFGPRTSPTISFTIINGLSSNSPPFVIREIEVDKRETVWCLEVEDDHSFIFPFGVATGNCLYGQCDRPRFFQETLYALLCGSGVGFSVQKHHVAKLPSLYLEKDEDSRSNELVTFTIPDSIEGWADAVGVLISSYMPGPFAEYAKKEVVFDYSAIRPAGSPLSHGCGKAPGYSGLKEALEHIQSLLERAYLAGVEKLRPIDCYDIVMYAADAVLSGGVRRSSTISIFSLDDEEMMNAKTGNWYDEGENPQRSNSNNSALLLRGKVTFEQFAKLVDTARFGGGEPGFLWADSLEAGFNPCLSADATVMTASGVTTIANLQVGQKIWSTEGWTTVTAKWSTGFKEVYLYTTEHDSKFLGTENHKVFSHGTKTPVGTLSSIDTFVLDTDISTFPSAVISRIYKGIEEVFDITVDNSSHSFWSGACNVSNCAEIGMYAYDEEGNSGFQGCNLVEINGSAIDSMERFLSAAKAAALIGTLQAGYTKFPYLGEATEKIFRREALLGVSITGIMDSPEIILNPDNLKKAVDVIRETNQEIAKKIGINPAARLTTIKPSGTSSLVLGTASGIHPHHAKRYLRHVQANKMEAPLKHFRKFNPLATEQSFWADTDEVITFCVEVPDGSKLKNQVSAIQLLENVKLMKKHWIDNGKNPELCVKPWLSHNVSNTISIRNDEEWEEVKHYIFDNQQFFAGITLTSSDIDKDYAQAPLCAVYTANEIAKQYGDGSVVCSGIIEDALEVWKDEPAPLWKACSVLLGTSPIPDRPAPAGYSSKGGIIYTTLDDVFQADKVSGIERWLD